MSEASIKASNPKDAIGLKKLAWSFLPWPVLGEAALGMFEGGLKYGRHNYRVIGVRASVYFDATMRHLTSWWEGQDDDPDSKLNHITKAITSLIVLRDAMMQDKLYDDRPPKHAGCDRWVLEANAGTERLLNKYPDPVPPYVAEEQRPTATDETQVKPGDVTWLEPDRLLVHPVQAAGEPFYPCKCQDKESHHICAPCNRAVTTPERPAGAALCGND
jgi:hypothetical protein